MTCKESLLQHDYDGHVSYPYRERLIYDHHDNFTTRGQQKLYSDSLLAISRRAEANVDAVKEKLMAIDPCRAYGLMHWHPENISQEKENDWIEYREDAEWPKWDAVNSVFSTDKERNARHKREEGASHEELVRSPCYLCTTLEEHEQHIARRGQQFKATKKPKPRIKFIPPPPIVKVKDKEPEEKTEVLYKFAVTTGNAPHASTSANVTVKMKGTKGIMRPRPLKKKIGVNFVFGRGTTEVFYIKGPKIGDLKLLAVEHDGLERRHAWQLEHVEVTNMATEQTWFFPCRCWISLYHGDHALKKVLQGGIREVELIEYEVTVVTGDLVMAGTSANVYITIYGKKGVGRKTQLKSKDMHPFERAKKDKFYVTVKENILPLTKIRIEHDNTGAKPQWFVEKVLLHDLSYNRDYKFPCGRWLAEDKADGNTFVDLYPFSGRLADVHRTKDGKKIKGPSLKYTVTVLTGTERYGGTDAHVFLQLFGKRGESSEIELNEGLDHFEQGQTDEFTIRLEDVGDIKRIVVRHDNTGLGAGWFLEKMTIRRFFSAEEIHDRLQMMGKELDDTVAKRASKAGLDVDLSPRPRKSLRHEKSRKSSGKAGRRKRGSSQDSDGSDAESATRSQSRSRHGRHKRRGSSGDSGSDDSPGRERKDRGTGRRYSSASDWTKSGKSITWEERRDSDDEYDDGGRKSRRRGEKRRDSAGVRHRRNRGRSYDSDTDDGRKKKSGKERRKKRRGKYDSSDSDSDVYYMNRMDKKGSKKKSRHSDESNSDSDDDSDSHRRRRRKRHGKHQSDSESETGSESESGDELTSDTSSIAPATSVWRENRVPYFDEYLFVCRQWLATDEGDGQIEREFTPKTVTTFFKIKE